jgi:hypothetical protein
LLRLLPAGATVAGWDSHPLENSAFPRRTGIQASLNATGKAQYPPPVA